MNPTPERGTRERIIEVAEEFFGDRGYHGTRLHLIAERVGIQKASLFHYFASKAALYHAVLGEGVEESERAVRRVLASDARPADKLRMLLENYVDLVASHPARTKILLRQSLGDAPNEIPSAADSDRLMEVVTGFVSDNQKVGVFTPVDPLALVLGVIGMVAFFFTSAPVMASKWCADGHDAGVARIKRHVVEVVERSLGVRPAGNAVGAQAVRA